MRKFLIFIQDYVKLVLLLYIIYLHIYKICSTVLSKIFGEDYRMKRRGKHTYLIISCWQKIWKKLVNIEQYFFKNIISVIFFIVFAFVSISMTNFELLEKDTIIYPKQEFHELEKVARIHQNELINSNIEDYVSILPDNIECDFTINNNTILANYTASTSNGHYKTIYINTVLSIPENELKIVRSESPERHIMPFRKHWFFSSLIFATQFLFVFTLLCIIIAITNSIKKDKEATKLELNTLEKDPKILIFPTHDGSKQSKGGLQ